LGAPIVSIDSMQVYRKMDIGTAKPDAATRARFGYRMVNVAEPEEDYGPARFQREGRAELTEIAAAHENVVIVGGSGLYFRALVDPLQFPPTDAAVRALLLETPHEDLVAELTAADTEVATVVDLANPRRVVRAVEVQRITGRTPRTRAATAEAKAVRRYHAVHDFTAVGVDAGGVLADRVVRRFDQMMEDGLLDEVAALAPRLGILARQAVGYKELLPVLDGVRSVDDGRELAIRATMALAKRQRTFFRRDPRIRWLAWQDDARKRRDSAVQRLEEAGAWTS
jgi:tRNA dimethylallyltransferase